MTTQPDAYFCARLFAACVQSGDAYCARVAELVRRRAYGSYWESIGYQYLGPLLVAFSDWLRGKAAGRRLYFLARDGEVMLRVYRALFPEEAARAEYLLASRALATSAENAGVYRDYLASRKVRS